MDTHFPQDWKFPHPSHPVNAHFDRIALFTQLDRADWRDWITLGLPRAKESAKRFFASKPKARAFVIPVWRADGSVQLVSIGPRGGHKVLWTFRQAG